MVSGQCVLVVDGLSETEQVLKAVLEPRGLRVDRVRRRATASEMRASAPWASAPWASAPAASRPVEARVGPRPSLVVLHASDYPADADTWRGVPRVIIGSASLPEPSTDPAGDPQYLPHPFQYRELIGAIERLLARSPEAPAA